MSVDLSIENVPDDVVRRLRERAERNHRSLQGELLTIIEAATRPEPDPFADRRAFFEELEARGFTSPSESVEIIRAMRDGR